jgi:hypothetical protein
VLDFQTVNVFAGAPGAGKTTLTAEWLLRMYDGRTICGLPTGKPTAVYYLSTDRSGHSTKRLFATHNLPDDYLIYYNPIDDPQFDLRQLRNSQIALDTLRWCVDRLNPQPGSLLCTDPAAPFFVPGSPNDPRAVAVLMTTLHVIARERQITILVYAHFGKQSADQSQRYRRPQDRIAGSLAWSGFSDAQMFLVEPEPPQQPYHIFGWNPRHSAPAEFKFERRGPVFVPYRALEDVGAKIQIPANAAATFMLIPVQGIATADLWAAVGTTLGVHRATFFRYLDRLEELGAISRTHGYVKRVPLEAVETVHTGESEEKAH